jgi:hypothetical protein
VLALVGLVAATRLPAQVEHDHSAVQAA